MAEREAMLAQFSAELESLDADVQVRGNGTQDWQMRVRKPFA